MAAVKEVELIIPQGTTFVYEVTITDLDGVLMDLTGFKARLQARNKITDLTPIYFAVSDPGEVVGIALPHLEVVNAGLVRLTIADETSAAFTFKSCVFDLEIVSPAGRTYRPVKGTWILDPEVTRA